MEPGRMGKVQKHLKTYKLIRALHRDIGFFLIGLTVIYSISGIVLTFRDTGFLKKETTTKKVIATNLNSDSLGKALHLRNLHIIENGREFIRFESGIYNKTTGAVSYTSDTLPVLIEIFNKLHKSSTKGSTFWFTTLYGGLLLFLAVSSFWMFRPGTKKFKRGVIISGAGFIISAFILTL